MKAASSRWARPKTSTCARDPRFVAGFLGAVNWIGSAASAPRPSACCPRHRPTPPIAAPPASSPARVFLGDCVQVLVRLESGEDAVAQVPRRAAAFQPGDAVHVSWNAADEMTFS